MLKAQSLLKSLQGVLKSANFDVKGGHSFIKNMYLIDCMVPRVISNPKTRAQVVSLVLY